MLVTGCRGLGTCADIPRSKYSYICVRIRVKRCIPGLRIGEKVCSYPYICQHLLTRNRNSTVGDVARKVMGDVPIAYVEGAGGVRVSEDEIVAVGKHDVRIPLTTFENSLLI